MIRNSWMMFALVAGVTVGSFSLADAPAADKVTAALRGSLFQPADFASLGTLTVDAGKAVRFDTGSATTLPSISGVLTGKGQLGVSQSGEVQVAVFAFDSIQLGKGATVTITGDRGIVLLSKNAIAIDTTLSVSGANGQRKHDNAPQDVQMADGGPGGDGGVYGKSLDSAPPPAHGGNGGPPMKDTGQPGRGFGAGFNERVKGGAPGGGGAYGGAGGDSTIGSQGNGNPPRPCPGGKVYGDAALADLFGGSGGAGGSHDRSGATTGGGGAGGAIALIARTSIELGADARILAEGGASAQWHVCGGGGSGGAILIAAPTLKVDPAATISAAGGAGASGLGNIGLEIVANRGRRQSGSGGGGGGGRIAIYTNEDLGQPGKDQIEKMAPKNITLNVDGGNGGYKAQDGAAGTIYDGKWIDLK